MIIDVINGCFSYKGGRKILNGINFHANKGELIAVLGPNGAGKTTFLKCMMGLLKWKNGESLLDGKALAMMSTKEVFEKIAYVPQARSVMSSNTVFEMVLLGRSNQLGMFSKPSKRDVAVSWNALKRLNIDGLADKSCSRLSGGELQMVLIARALAAETDIIVLDEPESNLDFKNQLIVLNVLSELSSSGMTCIFNTHYPSHALQRADKALILKSDGSHLFGEAAKVVTEENIEDAFGVHAIIGEVETPENMIKSVVPVELITESNEDDLRRIKGNDRRIAVISVIASEFGAGEKINEIFHEYSRYLIGRMGMPYRTCSLFIINATMDAPASVVECVMSRLGKIKSVSVKATYAKGNFEET